jgi:hypothetical protein
MGIVSLGVERAGILRGHAAAEALPRIAVGEVGSVRLDEYQLLAGVDAGRVWGRGGADKLDVGDDVVPVGREVAGLESADFCANTTSSSRVDRRAASAHAVAWRDGGQGKLDYFDRLRLRGRPGRRLKAKGNNRAES